MSTPRPPIHPSAWKLEERANTLYRQERYDLAMQDYSHLLNDDPQNPVYQCRVGMCLLGLGHLQQAFLNIEHAVAENPNVWVTHYFRSLFANYSGWVNESFDSAYEAARLGPHHPAPWAHLARLHQWQGQGKECLEAISKAMEFDPINSDFLAIRSWALVILGRREEADAMVQQALRSNPEGTTAHVAAGIARLRDSPDAAISHLYEALRIDPNNRQTHEVVKIARIMAGRTEENPYGVNLARTKASQIRVIALIVLLILLLVIAFR